MRFLMAIIREHWRRIAALVLVAVVGSAYAVSPFVRGKTHTAWHTTLSWAGVGGESVDTSKVFWCPMHPQIKSNKKNAVCPICNMALVELEGGIVEPPKFLTLTAQQIQQAGVASEPVMYRRLFREIDTTGRIDFDERRLAKITSWVRGKSRIEKLHVNYKGIHVEQGKPLAELYSPELIVAQQEYLSALRALSRSGASVLDDELMQSARQKLKYQGLLDAQIDRLTTTKRPEDRISILAPISGTVHKRNVQEGQYVMEGDVLFELVDLSRLWVFADIFEEELPLVKLGLPVDITVEHLPGEVFTGEIAFIDYMVKPGTRTISIRIDVANDDHRLKAGMFARVGLKHERPRVLGVPESAVLWSGSRSVVIVRTGDGAFEPREVQVGERWLFAESTEEGTSLDFAAGSDRYHEIIAGLSAGESVVTSGAFLLNSESQFQSVLTKLLPPREQRASLEQVLCASVAQPIRELLSAYFAVSEALAADRIREVPEKLQVLRSRSQSLVEASSEDMRAMHADAQQLDRVISELASTSITDAVDARTRFGRLSHEMTRFLEAHGGPTLFGRELYQFECGMAKVGYERWLWWSPEIHNPYMGQKMLTCGTKLDVLKP